MCQCLTSVLKLPGHILPCACRSQGKWPTCAHAALDMLESREMADLCTYCPGHAGVTGNGRPVHVLSWTCRSHGKWPTCTHTALDIPESRKMAEHTDWLKKQTPDVACVSADLKCRGGRDTTCTEPQSGDITPSIAWRIRGPQTVQELDDRP